MDKPMYESPRNPDYTQIFYVGHNNPRFPYSRHGYLPALETPSDVPPIKTEPPWTAKQWDVVNQLKGQVLHLQEKVNFKSDKKKKVYNKYEV